MATRTSGKAKRPAPDHTFAESKYLRHLVETEALVAIHLFGGEQVCGVIEFYDASFIRLTRDGSPNLFIFKHQIKYLYEQP